MNKTLKNVIYNVSYQILNIIIPLITAPYIARVMGPEGVGVYSYSTSVASFATVLMLLGMANYGSRTIAFCKEKGKDILSEKFWSMYLMQLVSSIFVLVLYEIYAIFLGGNYRLALLAQVFLLLSVMIDIGWYFTGTGQFKVTVTRGMIIKVLQTILIFSFVKRREDLITYILIITVGALIGQAMLWPIALKQIGKAKVSVKSIVAHIKPNLVLFLPLLASSVFIYMDKIMLQLITDVSTNLGWYEYAEKIVRLPLTVISAIGAVMMPKVASVVSQKGRQEVRKYLHLSMRYIAILGSAMCFGIMAIAPELSIVYLGEEFSPCGMLMQVLSCIILFSAFANVLRTQYLIPMKRDRVYAFSIIAGAGVNLILNMILIPYWGSFGAATGTIGAEVAVCVGHIWGVHNQLNVSKYLKEWIVFLICGIAMFFLVRGVGGFVQPIFVRLIIGIIIGAIGYCIMVAGVLYIMKDRMLFGILKKTGIRL